MQNMKIDNVMADKFCIIFSKKKLKTFKTKNNSFECDKFGISIL